MPALSSKTVWVLGAGFSAPLGGPLLADLFRPEESRDLEIFYPEQGFPTLAAQMYWTKILFNWGKAEHRWSDAEEFLTYLDDAFLPSGSAKKEIVGAMCGRMRIRPPAGADYSATSSTFRPDVRDAMDKVANLYARRALAAECHRFLIDTPKAEEPWRPYRQWASGLDPQLDTIVTFNYDRVLESIADFHLNVVMPDFRERDRKNGVPVLKLHGSVDWVIEGGPKCGKVANVGLILTRIDQDIAIAVPGRSKASSVSELFGKLWEWGCDELRDAVCIVFLGYGFPKSDAKARMDLIGAIRNDNSGGATRNIEVILGPHTDRPETKRVMALLSAAKGNRNICDTQRDIEMAASRQRKPLFVKAQPMWVEDYIPNFGDHLADLRQMK